MSSLEDEKGWINSLDQKPECNIIIHAISRVGKDLDVVEAWWTGEKWVIPSVRSRIVSSNVLYWRVKPKIPDKILEKHK